MRIKILATPSNNLHNYHNIVVLCLLAHVLFCCIFLGLHLPFLAVYNFFSVLFYFGMCMLIRRRRLKPATLLVHAEVSFFVVLSTFLLGWDCGFSAYLIVLASLVYFNPFRRTYIIYLFSCCEALIFFILKLLTLNHEPVISLAEPIPTFFNFVNYIGCFFCIIYASFASKITSETTERVLTSQNTNLQSIADHDTLTHLYSRSYLMRYYDKLVAEKSPFCLVIADIDDFKKINDTFGHNCGDFILSELGTLFVALAPDDAVVCRWGGEEIILILRDMSQDECLQSIERIRESIAAYDFVYDNMIRKVTITFGLSYYTESNNLTSLIQSADDKLYYGKKHGKNQVVFEEV